MTVVLAYLVIATVPVNAFDMIRQGADESNAFLVEACKLGVAIILAADPAHIGRLYGADLLGAGLGCAVSVALIDRVSPPGVVMLAAGAFGLAGVRVARATLPRSVHVVGIVATALALALMLVPERLPDVVVDNTKNMNPKDRPPVLFTRWNSVFWVDVMDLPLFAHAGRALIHNGMWGSVLPRIDDDPGLAKRLEDDPRALPFAVLPGAPTVTIIGSAGGTEIVTALHLGAKHVTGVELNPVTVSLLQGPFKAYTGNVADDPRVRLVNAEGRAYLAATAEQSDLMWFVAPDSYAAMNAATSGAFVLSESYLYTAEMIEAALAHVGQTGIVGAQFGEIRHEQKPNRTTRYLTTASEAFRRLGIAEFPAHVIMATSPGFGFRASRGCRSSRSMRRSCA